MINQFIRGSEWSKWDLHVHTPSSIIQEYGGDSNESWEKYIIDLENLPGEFKVIGINDYIFLDGYRKVLEYKNKGRLHNIDLILPVIELRLDKFASLGMDDPWKRVNFHIIFSDQLTSDVIQTNFVTAIQHKLKLTIDDNEEDFNEIVTKETLIELGKKVKTSSSKQINDSDLKTGFNSITFNFDEIYQKLNATVFKDKFLTAIGKSEWDTMRWDGSPGSKKTVINKANFVFTSLENAQTYERQKAKLTAQNVNDRLLDCSDAHHYSTSTDKDRIGNCFTWLKANTTFEGLKQVCNEPSRIYIGDLPPLLKRVNDHPTHYIRKLSFQRIPNSRLEEIWFDDVEIEINPGLVAIIGNKGNGKSAIADTIGLVGNTLQFKDFSFLNNTKFRASKPNRAENFNAHLEWHTSLADEQNLNSNPHQSAVERVKYLPQGYLEKLCNENHEHFLDELRNVIFTHIPEVDKYGKNNLAELEKFRTGTIQDEIDQILIDLKQSNDIVIQLEVKDTDTYQNQLKSNLDQKIKDLSAHLQIKPIEIQAPTDPSILEKNKLVSNQIEEKRKTQNQLDANIDENKKKQKSINQTIASLEQGIGVLKLLETQYKKAISEITEILSSNEINIQDVIKMDITTQKIDTKIIELKDNLKTVTQLLDSDNPDGLIIKNKNIKEELNLLQTTLDEPSKLYQKYIDDLAQWTAAEKSIIGDKEQFNTIKYYESEFEYINKQLQNDLNIVIKKRKEQVKLLYSKKNDILNIFKTFYRPITNFIKTYGGVLEQYEIKLDIENELIGFEEKFFIHINGGAKGSFYGVNEGREILNKILVKYDLNSEEGVLDFIDEIMDYLKYDKRTEDNEKREVNKQLKGGYSVEDLYRFLFGLEYLEPYYKLKLNNKNISELSPGERGALLLIFYLALDQNDIPLIMDQPEENLDNQSVFKLLAQFIKKAKEKRQIIIVTHNPNLAVVCDADQIIHIKIEKHNKNKVLINSGALENTLINNTVVDILEGTYNAFDTRDSVYKIVKRR